MKIHKILSKLFLLGIITLTISSCTVHQNKRNIWATYENGNKIGYEYKIIPTDYLNIILNQKESNETYVLLRIYDDNNNVEEKVLKIESNDKPLKYTIKNIDGERKMYAFFTDVTINGDKVEKIEKADPDICFELKKETNEDKENKLKDQKQLFIKDIFLKYMQENSSIDIQSLLSGQFNIAEQNYNDKHTAYIVTWKNKNNPRIKLIFDWNGNIDEKYEDIDFWYYLENGNEIYNEMDIKREKAINDQ